MGPARVCGGEVDPVLVNRLLNEIGPDPDQLPVLQHALMRMWHWMLEQWPAEGANGPGDKILTLDQYKDIGETLGSSLDRHAEEVYDGLREDLKPIAETTFRCLTERAMGQRDRRRPSRLGEIGEVAGTPWEHVAAVAEVFRREDCNFVVPPPGEPLTPETTLDIGHESLIRQWQQLNHWVSQEAQSVAAYQRLVQQALRWNNGEAELWQGLDLERILKWQEDSRPSAAWARRYTVAPEGSKNESALAEKAAREFALAEEFIEQSKAKQAQELAQKQAEQERQDRLEKLESERKQKQRMLYGVVAVLVVVIVLAVAAGSGWYAAISRGKALEAERNEATNTVIRLDKARRRSFSSDLKTQADKLLEAKPGLAALLSLEGERLKAPKHSDLAAPARTLPPDVLFKPRLKALLNVNEWSAAVAFSPDGKRLAAADGKMIRVWELDRPWLSKTLKGHESDVQTVVFTPGERKFLVSTSDDGTIRVWDAQSLEEASGSPLVKEDIKVNEVAFSDDGRNMASAHSDGTVRLWDFPARRQINTLKEKHTDGVWGVAFSADGRWLASASADKTARVWDVANIEKPRVVGTYKHTDEVTDVAFSPDGQWLATLSDIVRLWNPEGKGKKALSKFSRLDQDEKPWSLAFSPDGKVLAQTNQNGTVRFWDLEHWDSKRSAVPDYRMLLRGHEGEVSQGAFEPNGSLYASVGQDGTVRLWDWQHPHHPLSRVVEMPGVPRDRLAIGYGADGLLLSFLDEKVVTVRDAEHGNAPRKLPYGELEEDSSPIVVFSANGTHLAIANSSPSGGHRRSDESSSEEKSTPIQIFDLRNDKKVSQLEVKGRVNSIALDRGGTRLAAAVYEGQNQLIRLWRDIENKQDLKKEVPAESEIGALAFSDGAILAAVGNRGIELLDTETLESKERVPRNPGVYGFSKASFSPAGNLLALGGYHGAIRLLNIKTGDSRDLEAPGGVRSIVFSPDGKALTALSIDGTVTRWQVDVESWQQAACAVANRNLSCDEWGDYIGKFFKKDEPYRLTCPNPDFSRCEKPELAIVGAGEESPNE